jgi:AcrR family transcriptional regulator
LARACSRPRGSVSAMPSSQSWQSSQSSQSQFILAAALPVFLRHGYQGTSLELIAEGAGVSRHAVTEHVGNKEEVFRAALQRLIDDQLAAAIVAASASGKVDDKLFRALEVRLGFLAEGDYHGELLASAWAYAGDLMQAFRERYVEIAESVLVAAEDVLHLSGDELSGGDAAELLVDAVAGITLAGSAVAGGAVAGAAPAVLRMRLRQLVDVVLRALERPGA